MTEGRIIAVGDIHGCSAALAALIEAVKPGPDDALVFLGDYIDRGPDSRGVLDQVLALRERCTVVPLLGNHEEMLLAALESGSELRYWLKFGGEETLNSSSFKRNPRLIEVGKLENPLVLANNRGTSPPQPFAPQEAFE